MNLTESTLEHATLSWLHELGYGVMHGPKIAPGEPMAERDSFGDVVQSRFARTLTPALSKRERGRCQPRLRRNPVIPGEARATIKRYLTVRFLRRLNP